MGNAIWPLFLIVGSNIAYQLSSRGAAKDVTPFAALVVAYTIATIASLALFLATAKGVSLAAEARALNWGNYVLGRVRVGRHLGFRHKACRMSIEFAL